MGRVLIAGIDPGTQSAFAVLSLSGELVRLSSSRNASPSSLIRAVSSCGKVAVVGTDVSPAPEVVRRVARVLGARVVEPDHTLQFREKIRIVDGYLKGLPGFVEIENRHEKDALCAALYALRRVNPLLKRIDDTLGQQKKEHLSEKVKGLVLVEGVSIAAALRRLS